MRALEASIEITNSFRLMYNAASKRQNGAVAEPNQWPGFVQSEDDRQRGSFETKSIEHGARRPDHCMNLIIH